MVNINKLNEEIKRDDIPKSILLQSELDSLQNRYKSLNDDFNLMKLYTKEMKNNLYENSSKNSSDSQSGGYLRDKEIVGLKQENKELEKKIEIMVDRMKACSEENKEYEDKIDKLKKDIKKLKKNGGVNSFDELSVIQIDKVEIEGKGNVQVICQFYFYFK